MSFYIYGKSETDYLSQKDEKMAQLIQRFGHIDRTVFPDLFTGLVNSIVGQQISGKTAEKIWDRFVLKFGDITPKKLQSCPDDEMKALGISLRKVMYIKNAAAKIISGELDVAALQNMSDDEVCKTLSSLDGVGVWTAQMLMIFSMQRQNVLSYGDFGIKKGISLLYGCDTPDKKQFEVYKQKFSPYCTVASFYLWQLANSED
ncbi:MAG: DNA-3-methyladenine glycosylase 2 family protein [Clostridia bacterium]|nr:DNA-3-methyladenine glycosylase 2 family protein [Clostridia bacterium]